MNYHNITTDDMLNGDGLRTVLWVSGCSHYCDQCQNQITWNPNDGVPFDECAKKELFNKLKPDYISGLTLSGGDPLYETNVLPIHNLIMEVKNEFPDKTIWLYSGYTLEFLEKRKDLSEIDRLRYDTVCKVDVFCDGKYISQMKSVNYPWVGSTNQHVIDIPETLKRGFMVLHKSV